MTKLYIANPNAWGENVKPATVKRRLAQTRKTIRELTVLEYTARQKVEEAKAALWLELPEGFTGTVSDLHQACSDRQGEYAHLKKLLDSAQAVESEIEDWLGDEKVA